MAGVKSALVIGGGTAAIDGGAMLTLAPNGLAALELVGLADAVRSAFDGHGEGRRQALDDGGDAARPNGRLMIITARLRR
jgi:hypothetical protein